MEFSLTKECKEETANALNGLIEKYGMEAVRGAVVLFSMEKEYGMLQVRVRTYEDDVLYVRQALRDWIKEYGLNFVKRQIEHVFKEVKM